LIASKRSFRQRKANWNERTSELRCIPRAATPPSCVPSWRNWIAARPSPGFRCESESGASQGSDDARGIGDAFHDAGHILGIAAGVIVIGLAVVAPLALLCLLAWLAHRLWLRTRRERALDA
jgi:hypothetical protein